MVTYTAFQDSIHHVSADTKGKGRPNRHWPLNSNAVAAAVIVQRNAELRALYVVVPPGNEAKPVSCPICEDTIKSDFLDEDWIWKNATKDDRVYLCSLN